MAGRAPRRTRASGVGPCADCRRDRWAGDSDPAGSILAFCNRRVFPVRYRVCLAKVTVNNVAAFVTVADDDIRGYPAVDDVHNVVTVSRKYCADQPGKLGTIDP